MILASAVYSARCNLPNGEEDLPSTRVPGVNRDAVIRVLAPPSVRRIGQTIPVTVDVELATAKPSPSGIHCVRLSASPGSVTFPLRDSCPARSAGVAGGGSGSSAGSGPVSTGGEAGDEGEPSLSTAESCIKPASIGTGRVGGVEIAAYLPLLDESSATFFASVYDTTDCSGRALATTAAVMQLRGEDEGEAGSNGEGGASAGGSAGQPGGGLGGSAGSGGTTGGLGGTDGGTAGGGVGGLDGGASGAGQGGE